MDLLNLRLFNQRLIGKKFTTPEVVVNYFGAVQSQDYTAAKWSLGLRLAQATDEGVEQALSEGRILRTHVLRPTWHFVIPEDIRAFLALTAPRIKRLTAYYNRQLGLTDDVLKRTNSIIANALRGYTYLTRQEIKTILEHEGITSDVQRLGHIVHNAEIESIITSGPRREKQFTYALLDERVPQVKELDRNEALARLAEKYFMSHGPAQIKDFAWWSGLSVKDATEGLHMIASKLESIRENGKMYWFRRDLSSSPVSEKNVFLLSVYDEYFISYTDRGDIVDKKYKRKLPIGNALLTSLIIIDGKVAGTWKRTIGKHTIEFRLFPFENLSKTNEIKIHEIVGEYGKFFGLKAKVVR